jgi:hypothetical protein
MSANRMMMIALAVALTAGSLPTTQAQTGIEDVDGTVARIIAALTAIGATVTTECLGGQVQACVDNALVAGLEFCDPRVQVPTDCIPMPTPDLMAGLGDSFTAMFAVAGAIPAGNALAVESVPGEDLVVSATVFVDEGAGWKTEDQGLYGLRLNYVDEAGPQRFPATGPALHPDQCDPPVFAGVGAPGALPSGYMPCNPVDGTYTYSIPFDALPPAALAGANGFQVQLQKMSEDFASNVAAANLFLPRDALLAEGAADAAPLADAMDAGFSPLFVSAGALSLGDGLVAAIALPDDAPTLAAGDVTVTVFTNGGGDFAPATGGSYNLVLQVDCGELAPIVEQLAAGSCAGGADVSSLTRTYPFTANPAGNTVPVSEADIAFLLNAMPATAVHVFVESSSPTYRASNYATLTSALMAGGAETAAVVDLLDAQLWNPVLVAGAAVPAGDGLVAAISLPEPGATLPAGDITVTVYTNDAGGFAPATSGSYNLVLQVDCGELDAAIENLDGEACAGGNDVTALTITRPFVATGTPVAMPVSEADLALLLNGLPATAVHVFVESSTPTYRASNYATATAALMLGGAEAAAVVDLVDAQLWNPVLVTGALPAGDGLVAAIALPDDAPILAAGDVAVTVFTNDGGDFAPANGGPYNLVLQVDCGDLSELVNTLAPASCAGGADVSFLTRTYPFTANPAGNTVTVSEDDLAFLLNAMPATAVHVFVESSSPSYRASNYATATSALMAGGADSAAVVDLVDAQLWNPVLVAGVLGVPVECTPGAPTFDPATCITAVQEQIGPLPACSSTVPDPFNMAVCAILAEVQDNAGDGFVADFDLDGAATAAGLALPIDDGALHVAGSLHAVTGETHAPYTGAFTLDLQVDCSEFAPVLSMAGPCAADNSDVVFHAVGSTADGAFAFDIDVGQLGAAFPEGVPLTALHVFVGDDSRSGGARYSSFSLPVEAAVKADPVLADALEAGSGGPVPFTPVLVVDAQAAGLPAVPPACTPVVGVPPGFDPATCAAAVAGMDRCAAVPAPEVAAVCSQLTAPGDGFVAGFSVPQDSPAPIALAGEDLLIEVAPLERDQAGAYLAYDGELTVYVQLNCGALAPALSAVADCASDTETLHSSTLAGPTDGAYVFTVPAADLAAAFAPTADLAAAFPDGYPVSAVNVFVGDAGAGADRRYSSFSLQANALVGAHAATADALQDSQAGIFTPVVLVNAPAQPPVPLPLDCTPAASVPPLDAAACAAAVAAMAACVTVPAAEVAAVCDALLASATPETLVGVCQEASAAAEGAADAGCATVAGVFATPSPTPTPTTTPTTSPTVTPPPAQPDLVAFFTLPDGTPVGKVPALQADGDLSFEVHADDVLDGEATPYEGNLTFYMQVDCGALLAVLGNVPGTCMSDGEFVYEGASAPSPTGDHVFVVPAAALPLAFRQDLPVSAVHLFVADDGSGPARRYSSFSLPAEVGYAATVPAGTPADLVLSELPTPADLLGGAPFTPVLLLTTAPPAAEGVPPGCEPGPTMDPAICAAELSQAVGPLLCDPASELPVSLVGCIVADAVAGGPDALVPGGDGLLGRFDLGIAVGPEPPTVLWDGADFPVVVDASQRNAEGLWVAYTGPLQLVVQRDCGSAEPALGVAVNCHGTDDSVGGLLSPVSQTGSIYRFVVPAAALAGSFEGLPATALHFFVQAPGQTSHFNQAKELLLQAACCDAMINAADGLEDQTFTPVVLLSPPAGVPEGCEAGPDVDPATCAEGLQGFLGPLLCDPASEIPVYAVSCVVVGVLATDPESLLAELEALLDLVPDPMTVGCVGPADGQLDCPTIVVKAERDTFREDGSLVYLVRLGGRAPTGTVTVALSTNVDDVYTSTASLEFKPTSWTKAQKVTLFAERSPVSQGTRGVTVHHAASGGGFDGATADLTATVVDPVRPGVVASLPDGASVVQGHAIDLLVTLASQPTSHVTVDVTYDGRVVAASPATMVFTPSDWNVGQALKVEAHDTGVEDDVLTLLRFAAHGEVETSGYGSMANAGSQSIVVQAPATKLASSGFGPGSQAQGAGSSTTVTSASTTTAASSTTTSAAPTPAPTPTPTLPPAPVVTVGDQPADDGGAAQDDEDVSGGSGEDADGAGDGSEVVPVAREDDTLGFEVPAPGLLLLALALLAAALVARRRLQ